MPIYSNVQSQIRKNMYLETSLMRHTRERQILWDQPSNEVYWFKFMHLSNVEILTESSNCLISGKYARVII